MDFFDFLTIWKSASADFQNSLKRSVLIKRLFEENSNWLISDYQLYRMDLLFSLVHELPIFAKKINISEIEKYNKILYQNSFFEFKINDEGFLVINKDKVFIDIPLPDDSIDLFHEIVNLPIYYSHGIKYNSIENLSFCRNLRWVFCYEERSVVSRLFNSFQSGSIVGMVLVKCGILKIDKLIYNLPQLKYLNISNNWIHAFSLYSFDDDNDSDNLRHVGIDDISCLEGLTLELLDISNNELITNIEPLFTTNIKLLNCKNTGIHKSDIKILISKLPKTIILENAKQYNDSFEEEDDRPNDYPNARDAFDTDDQYNDWLNG